VFIKKIEVDGLSRIKDEELIDMICLHPGDILDKRLLRIGIKRAFKKGIFLDIKAEAEPYETGIKLRYVVKEIPIIKHIRIEGNRFISRKRIEDAFIFKEGRNFLDGYLDKAIEGIKVFYRNKGFPDARVDIYVEKDKTPGYVNISLAIDEGQPLVIKKINILPEARRHIKVSEGDIFDREKIDKELQKLRSYYKRQRYLKPLIGPYEFKDSELNIPVNPGPRLEVVFKGNKALSKKRLLKEVLFFENEEVNRTLIQDTAKRIRAVYLRNGYNYAQVVGGIEKTEGLIKVTFFIFEGKRVHIRNIRFEGVNNISPDTLKDIIPLEEDEPFDEGLLDVSKESIVRFYNALGYIYAEVTEIKKDFKGQGDELDLIFVINEGIQVRIKEIDIKGNKAVSTSELLEILPLREGAEYNEIDIGDARYAILSLYNRIGYKDAKVDIETAIKGGEAFITFKITENEPYIFGKIIIRGNEKTKKKIIRRELAIKEGEPYNQDVIFKTRQRLYKLGLFTDISIEPLDIPDLNNNRGKGEPHTQDILIDLREGNPGSVEIGLGYGEYEQLRGFLDIGYSNLGGYNRAIGLRTELSSIRRRFILNFVEPWLFNKPSLRLKMFLTKEDMKAINLDTREIMYKVKKISLLSAIDRELARNLKVGLNYEYSSVETTDVKPGIIISKEDTGTLGISSISPSLFYDTRDNPFNPTSGSINGVMLKFASGILLSETEFIKAVVQSSWYFQLRRGLVFAFSFKGGAAHGLGESVELPLIERFFLGGRNTVRGYTHDTLGPKGVGDNPTGGNAFVLFNTEFRISLGKGFGLVTFVDSGNVWKKISNVSTELRYTTGLGLRYNTPVGPIRIDYGYKLNRERGESAGEIHFSLGHAF
jgi:outer membrane protein insertion porin family